MKFNTGKKVDSVSAEARTIDSLMVDVKSSNIKAIGYQPDKKEMFVDFIGGARYQFSDVAPEVFSQFNEVPSKGKFFEATIKGKYTSVKIRAGAPRPPKEKKEENQS